MNIHSFVEMNIRKGKRVVRGRQQPIYIGTPLIGVTGIDMTEKLKAYLALSGAGTEDKSYFLADIVPERSSWETAEGFDSKPMSATKARTLLLKYLNSIGMSKELMQDISGVYGIRHVLPSIADRSHAPDEERDMVGDWRSEGKAKRNAMRDKYSYARRERHNEVRETLVGLAKAAIAKATAELASSEAATWPYVYTNWPKGPTGRFVTYDHHVTVVSGPAIINKAEIAKTTKEPEDSSGSSSGEDSNSSKSDGSYSESKYNEQELETLLPWLLPKSANSKLHYGIDQVPPCGKEFSNHKMGFGLIEAMATGRTWCDVCFAELPREARSWLSS